MSWKTTYRELDHATLLGLLPVLEEVIARAKREVEAIAASLGEFEKFSAEYDQWLEQALKLREQGHDTSEHIAQITQSKQAHDHTQLEGEQRYQAMFGYLMDLESRRQWIRNVELIRRNLLPDPDAFVHGQAPPLERVYE